MYGVRGGDRAKQDPVSQPAAVHPDLMEDEMRFMNVKDEANATVFVNLNLVRLIEKFHGGLTDGTIFFFGDSETNQRPYFISSESFESVTDRIAQTS